MRLSCLVLVFWSSVALADPPAVVDGMAAALEGVNDTPLCGRLPIWPSDESAGRIVGMSDPDTWLGLELRAPMPRRPFTMLAAVRAEVGVEALRLRLPLLVACKDMDPRSPKARCSSARWSMRAVTRRASSAPTVLSASVWPA